PLCYRFGNSFVHGTMARQFSSSIAKALLIGSALCIVAPAVPLGGLAQARPAAVPFDREIAEFYRARAGAPLWFAPNSGRAAEQLVQLLASAQADHLNPRRYDVRGLARATADARSGNPAQSRPLSLNLERARALPAGRGRFVIVNPPAARLYMYENGQVVDSMRVVAGRPDPIAQTPMMNAFIRFVALNPYWNSPPDITSRKLAPAILTEGRTYFTKRGYDLVDHFGPDAHV